MKKTKRIPRPTHFGANLRYLRLLNGKTQKEIADAVGISRNKIATYEYGVVEPNVHTLLSICAFFGEPAESMLSSVFEEAYIAEHVRLSEGNFVQRLLHEQLQAYIQHNASVTKIVEGYRSLQSLTESIDNTSRDSLRDSPETLIRLLEQLLGTNWKWIETLSLVDNHYNEEE